MSASLMYFVLAALVRRHGAGFIHRMMPPVVIGPIIMIIGLSLAAVAVNLAMGKTGDGKAELMDYGTALVLASIALMVTIAVSVWAKGFFRLVPILAGVGAGYLTAVMLGLVDFSTVAAAPWIAVPQFVTPEWNLAAILQTIPTPVMGGIMMLLFGAVASVGLSTLVKGKVDFQQPRNLVIASVVLVLGIGGFTLTLGGFSLQGISLCGVAAILLNLMLPRERAEGAAPG